MTPEEKLLALIQQDKQPSGTPAPATPAPAAQPAAAAAAPKPEAATPPARETAKPMEPAPVAAREAAKPVETQPVAEKKLKLAAQPAPTAPRAPQAAAAEPAPPASTVTAPAASAAAGAAPSAVAADKEQAAIPAPLPTPAAASPAPPAGRGRPPVRTGGALGLVFANRVLAVVVLVLLVGVVYSIASIQSDVGGRVRALKEGSGVQPVAVAVVARETPLPVETFLDRVSVRDVFLPSMETTTTGVAVVQGKAADLKLVGVSLDTSKAEDSMAIIRNKAESKTYFVKQGQAVGETGYTLERVLSDRAILKMRKQEIELR